MIKQLLYVTGNDIKFKQAVFACEPAGLELVQTKLHIDEIQSEEGEPVARDKAEKAYQQLKQPLVVSDDSWMIPGLRGFPGPYMKSMNDWLTVQDWLNLTGSLTDRRIVLRQIVVYQDAERQKLFSVDFTGLLLEQARGKSPYPHSSVVSFDGGKHSNAEFHERGESAIQHDGNVWHEFVKWRESNDSPLA